MLHPNQKFFVCKSESQMVWLHTKGFNYAEAVPDKNRPWRNVYVYRLTPELRYTLSTWYMLDDGGGNNG